MESNGNNTRYKRQNISINTDESKESNKSIGSQIDASSNFNSKITGTVKCLNKKQTHPKSKKIECIWNKINKCDTEPKPQVCLKSVSYCDIIDTKVNNDKYIKNTRDLINNGIYSFEHMMEEIGYFKLRLVKLINDMKITLETTATIAAYVSSYNNIINNFYNNMISYILMEYRDSCGVIKKAILNLDTKELSRNITLTYTTCHGIVINDMVAIVDNMSVINTDLVLNIVIGNFTFSINYLVVSDFNNILDSIYKILDDIGKLEKNIDKNLLILYEGVGIINLIKLNI